MSGNVSNKKEKLDSKLARILNSAMAFMIAYLIIMFFMYLSTALMGKIFGFDVQLYYYGVKFQLGRHKWTTFNAFWIWSISTFFMLMLGAISSYVYNYFKARLVLANLVSLWAAVIAFSIGAAQGLFPLLSLAEYDRSPYYTNLSISFSFLGLPVVVMYIICILLMFLLVFVATNLSRPFLSFSYSFSKVNKRDRKRKYYFETVVLPFLIGSALLLLFYRETYQYAYFQLQNIVYLSVIAGALMVTFVMINISDVKSDEVLRYKNLQQLSAALFVIMVMLMVFLSVTWQGFYL